MLVLMIYKLLYVYIIQDLSRDHIANLRQNVKWPHNDAYSTAVSSAAVFCYHISHMSDKYVPNKSDYHLKKYEVSIPMYTNMFTTSQLDVCYHTSWAISIHHNVHTNELGLLINGQSIED